MTISKFNSENFNDNKDILKKLKENYLNSSLAHSSIIYGEKGIGKSTFVKYFTNKIFTNFSHNMDEVKKSKHTNLIINNSHPNLMIISKLIDEKTKKLKNNIIIDQIRNLESFIYQSSILNLPKIILIDSADDLNISSSNALLKVLEEPKKNTYFFLISHQLSRLLHTIRSRCIKFKFNKPTFNDFKKILFFNDDNFKENGEIEYLYDLSNGSPGLALDLYSDDTSVFFETFLNLCKERKILSNNILKFSSELYNYNNEQYLTFLIIVKFILSNILKINLGIDIKNNIGNKLAIKLNETSKYLNNSSCFKTLDYLSHYENNLFVFNLDKKLFTLNLFSAMAVN